MPLPVALGKRSSAFGHIRWPAWGTVSDNLTNFGVRQPGGHAGMRHIVAVWRTAFPDLHFEIQEEIVHDDKVVTRGLMRGAHLGEFQQGSDPADMHRRSTTDHAGHGPAAPTVTAARELRRCRP